MLTVAHEYRAQILRVIDGDTLVILADTGFNQRAEVNVRLIAVFAPELDEAGGPEAKAWVETWLAENTDPARRWPVLVVTDVTKVYEPTARMTFNRYVADIYEITSGAHLNAAINDYLASRTP